MSAQPSKKCEWCGNDTTTRCSVCRELLICSKACMKAIWPEHKRTCRKKAATAVDVLTEELSKVELDHERSLWLVIPEPEHKTIAKYMDVVSLCRTDSAMTGVEERKAWQKALKGLESVAMNKWPRYSTTDRFAGLRWGVRKRIKLQGFKIEKVVRENGTIVRREDHFGVICALGYGDIAILMVKSESIGLNSEGRLGGTPTYWAAYHGLVEMVRALVTVGADINKADNNGVTPLRTARRQGYTEVAGFLESAGATA